MRVLTESIDMKQAFAANNGLHGSTGISFTGTVKSFAQIGYMDEFEYFDAGICNRGVEKRRDVFHAWRKAQDVGASSSHHEE